VFCLATCMVPCDPDRVSALAAEVVARAVVNAVRAAETLGDVPCSREIRARA